MKKQHLPLFMLPFYLLFFCSFSSVSTFTPLLSLSLSSFLPTSPYPTARESHVHPFPHGFRGLCHVSVRSPSISHHHLAPVAPLQAGGHQCKELRSGQASSWTVSLGRGVSIQDVLGVLIGLEVSGGGGQQKQAVCQWCFVLSCSSSLPLVWTWILVIMSYLVALWWLCVLFMSVCVCVFISLCLRPVCLILCISTFLCINPAHTSSATVGLLLV